MKKLLSRKISFNNIKHHFSHSRDSSNLIHFNEEKYLNETIVIHYTPNEWYDGYVNEDYLPHGTGNYFFPNQDVYFGDFVNGVREGQGTYQYTSEGSEYSGSWKNDKKDGDGFYQFKDGFQCFVKFQEDRLIDKIDNIHTDFWNAGDLSGSRIENYDDIDQNSLDLNGSMILNINEKKTAFISPQKARHYDSTEMEETFKRSDIMRTLSFNRSPPASTKG